MKNMVAAVDCILNSESGMTLTQVMDMTKLPKTTAYRCLENLTRDRLLYKSNNKYVLGPIMLRWMNTRGHEQEFVKLIRPYLEEIAVQTKETVHLVQRQGNRGVYIDKIEGESSFGLKSRIGEELNLYSTGAGRAILMSFSEEQLDAYFSEQKPEAHTEKTITNVDVLKKELEKFHSQGYAEEVEQNEKNIQCVGICFRWGTIDLAISVTTTLLTDYRRLKAMGENLLKTGDKMIQELMLTNPKKIES